MSKHSHQPCTFCQLIARGLPPHGIYENDTVLVILDRDALSFGHCLILTRQHAAQVHELDEAHYGGMFQLAKRLAPLLGAATASQAVAYVAFGSGLPHAHLHLVPHNDPAVLLRPLDFVRPLTDSELNEQADRLRRLLGPELLVFDY